MANFAASDRVHFVQDQELNPAIYAEQFADPDPMKAQTSEELLRRARLILMTELGKDPILRDYVRRLFKEEALITIEPTERGIVKIDQNHPYNVRVLNHLHSHYVQLSFRTSSISSGSLSGICWNLPSSYISLRLKLST